MPDSSHVYKQILDTGRDGITINSDRIFMYVNGSFAKMIGYSVDELIGMDIFHVTASEHWENVEERTRRRQIGEDVVSQYELELVRKDGSRFPVEFSVSRIDFEGKSSSLTIVRDISVRKQSEEALRVSEERYQTLWEQSSDGLVIIDGESGGILDCNEAFKRLTGRTSEELQLLKIWDISPESQFEAARKIFSVVREAGSGGSSELQISKPFGVLVDVEFSGNLLVINGKKVLVSRCRDISERKQAEKALVESEERYRGLFDNMIDGFAYHKVVYGDNGEPVDYTFLEINDCFTELVGLGREIIGKNVTEVIPGIEDDPADWIGVYGELAKNGGELRFEQYSEPLGKWYNVSAYSPRPGYFAALFQDVTEQNQMDEALQVSEALFRGFMQSATDGFIMFDEALCIVEVNDRWLQYAGLGREEVIGKMALDVLPEMRGTGDFESFLKVLETGEPVEYHAVEVETLPGIIFDVSVFKAGDVLGVVTRDVTERVQLEERLSMFMESATDGFLFMDSELRIIDVNQTWLKSTGKTREVIGQLLGDVFPFSVESEHRYNAYRKVVETGKSVEFTMVQSPPGVGSTFNFKAFRVGSGVGLISSDVTERVLYQRRLEALNEHVTQLATQNTVQEVIAVTFNIIEDLFGYDIGSFGLVEGDNLHHIILPQIEAVDDFYQPINGIGVCPRAVRTGGTQFVNETRGDPDFIMVDEDVYAPRSELVVPIRVEGEVGAVLNIVSLAPDAFSIDDVKLVELLANHVGSAMNRIIETEKRLNSEQELMHERVQRESEQELGRLKTQFMSTATHEIRTPLTAILGYIELIDDASKIPDVKSVTQYYQILKRNALRLSSLTNDLLDVQRLESNRMELYRSKFNLKELVSDIIGEISPLYTEKTITIDQKIDADLLIWADRDRIQQVLVNFLVNAFKFSPENSRILITAYEDPEKIAVSVVDEGIGIDISDLPKLFTPFPDIEPIVRGKGSGLGLSICKGILELHGGDAWGESEGQGKGSTFTFTLPTKE